MTLEEGALKGEGLRNGGVILGNGAVCSRRDFLKMGCLSVGVLIGGSMVGCSSQGGAGSSDSAANEEGAPMGSSESAAPAASAGGTAVVYFSCTGNTEAVAEKVTQATGGALMRIEPAEPYTAADLDYNSDCRANTEQNNGGARPAIATPVPDVAAYDTVYLGYPIWWGTVPRIILTFLDGADLAGKTIVPFCTSGSSPISGSIAEIRQAAPGADVLEGRRFSAGASQQEVDAWVAGI